MINNRLVSMVDLVLEQNMRFANKEINQDQCGSILLKYAHFLKQPLKLEMLVPCDDEGNVLENPVNYSDKSWSEEQIANWGADVYFYNQAKEKVLFEGIGIDNNGSHKTMRFISGYSKDFKNFTDAFNGWTVENLTIHSVTLTESSIKQIGL